MAQLRALVLAGTSEARALCEALAPCAGFEAIASLAGRTAAPLTLPVPTRVGGFGGVEGLGRYLREERIGCVVAATHPFATQIAANAVTACKATDVPLLVLRRHPWREGDGDRWIEVDTMAEAAEALGDAPKRVFLSAGRLGVAAFRAKPQHAYVMRSIDAPPAGELPPDCKLILARGPFALEDETRLLQDERIDVLVSKNGGGPRAKLDAARALGLSVVMIRMPPPPDAPRVATVAEAVAWIEAHRSAP